ncbi:PEP-CTERM protein-sorting domain-containing protein [Gemmobacter megaterium]|uniref:PEP-CTERM protein-sorting domain-containing protein n=1 Tax=Gemmobacter megaterium TaxID=1086013 RepID=A0A1N7LQY5_9RHOB|nr:hypothetical protein [Gemmobacter megaterium]GGE11017.1 hypothetical protein GCM10011345_16240 [Gemmobacter megaterium]SIS76265.1 PEP-CTERM protein-sorting domain-containing protein [Gemmobacter megaterium]
MIILAGLLIGAVWGASLARKRKGSRLDIAQYAVGFAIAFGILGLFATLIIDRFI